MMQPGEVNLDVLGDAQDALILLDEPIVEGRYGDIEGIDTVEIGMDSMASALARIFAFPETKGARMPDIEEVLAYLASESVKRVDKDALEAARRVLSGVRRARYQPLTEGALAMLESARSE
ncbi:MAG: hypothetical protein ACMG6S_04870, partial [Byssovorax sp.]